MTDKAKGSKFTVILSAKEREMLENLVRENGLSAAAWLRTTIRAEHKKLARKLAIIEDSKR